MKNSFFQLTGKVAVVTGAGSGIGRAIAQRFAAAGATVTIWDTNGSNAELTKASIAEQGDSADVMDVDVADAGAVETAVADLVDRHGRLDILVNNAGISSVGTVASTTPAELERVFRVNVAGVANGIRAAVPVMLEQSGGVILNMASIASMTGLKDRFAYSASKGAVLTMTYSVAMDYVEKGIRCNCIAPARIHTPFVDDYLAQNYPGREKEVFDELSAYQPLGRMGGPDEVAGLAHYLCSDEAAFITGSVYRIDGGVCTMPGM